MDQSRAGQEEYIRQVLDAYRQTPGTNQGPPAVRTVWWPTSFVNAVCR